MRKVVKISVSDLENMVRKVISEQTESNNCTGNNEVNSPIITTKITYKDKNETVPSEVGFYLKAHFPSTGSSDEVYQEALSQLKKQVEDKLSSKQLNDKYNLVLVRVSSVIGSASNYLNGPLQPTHSGANPIDSSKLSSEPYVNLPKEGDKNWNNNKGYADSRWGNMVSYINKNGESIGFGVGKDLTAPKTTEFRITDTGGCIDEKRDVNKYKGPGQYVIVKGFIRLEKKVDITKITQLSECASGLKIIVGFFKEEQQVDGITMKKNNFKENQGHSCDYATFTVYCNGVPVGISNMNNGTGRLTGSNPKAMVGLDQPNVFHRPPQNGTKIIQGKEMPKGFGDTVYSVISVSDEKLKEIAKKSENGKIEMRIQGTPNTLLRPGKTGGGYHGEAPMVCAYITENKGGKTEKRIVYEANEPFNTIGDVSPKESKPIGSFNPCDTVEKI